MITALPFSTRRQCGNLVGRADGVANPARNLIHFQHKDYGLAGVRFDIFLNGGRTSGGICDSDEGGTHLKANSGSPFPLIFVFSTLGSSYLLAERDHIGGVLELLYLVLSASRTTSKHSPVSPARALHAGEAEPSVPLMRWRRRQPLNDQPLWREY